MFAPRDSLGLFGLLGLLGLLAHPPALVLSFRASKKVPLGTGDTGGIYGRAVQKIYLWVRRGRSRKFLRMIRPFLLKNLDSLNIFLRFELFLSR